MKLPNLAWDHEVEDSTLYLYRVVIVKSYKEKNIRSVNYFADLTKMENYVGRALEKGEAVESCVYYGSPLVHTHLYRKE